MRRKQVVSGFNNSQKIRVIVDGVGFYMTVGETVERFATSNHRIAVETTLTKMAQEQITGFGQRVSVYDSRMKQTQIDVQVDIL